ncbi:MAG: type I-E CRISPR-associated protein Cas5/CasD [Gammaproteobacteria bacterium]|nr:type I-E CRISPR-associated protein Cas5/CasD [Gammaproteobacteria bacterium]MDE0440781.1 type I-E CRISPR-associated protein Cas5/CasD [Gammaproteobacteria bacterium]
MSYRWLVLRLEAPLMAFGGVAIDQVGPVRDFPSASMIIGLVGNALGWHWRDRTKHQTVQDRLVFGARREKEGTIVTDVQNAQLAKTDKGWTTRGEPDGRDGASYGAPHRRVRDYHADTTVRVVMRFTDESMPTLDDVANAIESPNRPLYIGRKPCLPSHPLIDSGSDRWATGTTVHEALGSIPGDGEMRALWPVEEGPESGDNVDRVIDLADIRNWHTGFHAGWRRVVEGRLKPASTA